MHLPASWGMGQADIHSSLLITLGLMSAMLLLVSLTQPGLRELQMAAITLPIVWIVSLAVRVAVQQLSVGAYSYDMETVVGPSGNLSNDYEYLPASRIAAYAAGGQLATLGLILLGLIINAAMAPAVGGHVHLSDLMDFKSGWGSRAWASQIMWVNIFIGMLQLLPTVPFDMRAAVFAYYSRRNRNAQEPEVYRRIASFDTHLAAVLFGLGLATALFGWFYEKDLIGWYAAIAAAVYLFVASQWEVSRADDLEAQYAPLPVRTTRQDAPGNLLRPHFPMAPPASESGSERATIDSTLGSQTGRSEPASNKPSRESVAIKTDVDEILRKLHREGADSLSSLEQEALLSASRELKEKRSRST